MHFLSCFSAFIVYHSRNLRSWVILLGAIFVQTAYINCGPSFLANNNSEQNYSSLSRSAEAVFKCNNEQLRGTSERRLRRLTRFELHHSLVDLFGQDVVRQHESFFNFYNKDRFAVNDVTFDPSFDENAVRGIYELSERIASQVASNTTLAARIAPTCLITNSNFNLMNETCLKTFIESFGLKVFRRPLSAVEYSKFFQLLRNGNAVLENNSQRVRAFVMELLLSPAFIFHMTDAEASSPQKEELDQYSIASRLSFKITGSFPDAELFAAAARGELTNKEALRNHAVRLIQTPKGRAYVREVFTQWLRVDAGQFPSPTYGNSIGISDEGLVEDLQKEALDFVEHIVFEKEGNFQDLMTAEVAFPPSANSAKIFGLNQVSLGPQDPKAVSGTHVGLLMRPILFLSTTDRTSPIHRGYVFNKQFLCQQIPEPSPNDLAQAGERAMDLDPLMTTSRQRAQHLTAPTSCSGCHQFINPPGFLFEQFGPFGEIREREAVFNSDGNFVRDLPIDTRVDGILIDRQSMSIGDGKDAANIMAQSAQAPACFATQLFRFSRFSRETSSDHCHLSDVEKIVRENRPILESFIENAITEDILWVKKAF